MIEYGIHFEKVPNDKAAEKRADMNRQVKLK